MKVCFYLLIKIIYIKKKIIMKELPKYCTIEKVESKRILLMKIDMRSYRLSSK